MGLMNFWRLQITMSFSSLKNILSFQILSSNESLRVCLCCTFLFSCSFCVCHLAAILFLAHLSSVPHVNEGTHWLEGTGTTGQEVSAVVGLQETDKVGALRLQEERRKRKDIQTNCNFMLKIDDAERYTLLRAVSDVLWFTFLPLKTGKVNKRTVAVASLLATQAVL